ncbi:MAG TPA: carboxymuconolactone decarboxylase family protein [Vicinamibacterales bacterium]|nr:carboxymuconolactone decarboxylase family protein [Vicinamibacterales bacterium]
MKNVAFLMPEAMQALVALGRSAEHADVPRKTIDLMHLRASQLNGCSVCVDMHWRAARQAGETDERIFGVAAWRDMPYFTDAERAALALTEAVTRIADDPDAVPDAVWNEAARHYDERGLAALLVAIVTINAWNRLNIATRQVAFGRLPEAVSA